MATRDTKNFRKDSQIDQWGDFSKLAQALINKAQKLRDIVGKPIYVTSGFREGSTSQHGLGLALDIISPEFVIEHSLMDFYLLAEKVGFNGIGIYPHWKWQNQKRGGLHIDTRKAATAARWMGVLIDESNPLNRQQKYIGLTLDNLRRYKVAI